MTIDAQAGAPAGPVTVAFANEGDYHSWHDGKCLELGIPVPGHNQGTGHVAIVAQWTTAYAAPRIIDGYWTVTLSAEEVAADPVLKSLEVLTVKYPATPGGDTDENGQPISIIEVVPPEVYEKPLPGNWTDPQDGVTYDTRTGDVIE